MSNFVFDDIISSKFGMRIAHIGSPGVVANSTFTDIDIISDRSGRGNESYIYGRRLPEFWDIPIEFYNKAALQYPSYEVEAIQEWLFGKSTPRYLSILDPDKGNFSYLCYLVNPSIVKIGGMVIGWRCSVRSTKPYADSDIIEVPYHLTSDSSRIDLYNLSTVPDTYLYPEMSIQLLDNTTFVLIQNDSDNGRLTEFHGLRRNEQIFIDNRRQIIKSASGDNLLNNFNMNFFRLTPGNNHIYVDGRVNITFRYRLQMAVGAF